MNSLQSSLLPFIATSIMNMSPFLLFLTKKTEPCSRWVLVFHFILLPSKARALSIAHRPLITLSFVGGQTQSGQLWTWVNTLQNGIIAVQAEPVPGQITSLQIRVFHKNTFPKEKNVHTLTTPYRAYMSHTQKIFFPGQVLKVPPLSQKWRTFTM